jgi:multicomponent Na+:H+ antiporter subunit D
MNIDHPPYPALLVAIPLLTAVFLPVVGWWKKRWCFPLALAALTAMVAIAVKLAVQVVVSGEVIHYYMGGWEPPWGIEFRLDHLSSLMAVLITTIALIIGLYSFRSVQREVPDREPHFYAIFLLLIVGLIGIIATGDMFNLYVFLEISSITGYALISLGNERAPFSTYRYLVLGTIGACFYLLGVGYLYSVTGSLNMEDLARLLPALYDSKVVLVSFSFFVVGIGVKLAVFPLHVWLPDAYTDAPSAVSALIAPTMTKVAAYVMLRVVFTVFEPSYAFEKLPVMDILGWLAAAAIIYGSVRAIAQNNIKRMLAFSSVAQVGYILLGVALGNENGFVGGVLHIVNHAFMKGCLFAAAGAIFYKWETTTIEDFGELNAKMPFTSFGLLIAALSMIGIPPTAGFFSKWYLILGCIDAERWVFVGVIMVSSLLNAAYFFRILENMYLKNAHHKPKRDEAPVSMLIPIFVLAAGVMVLGFLSFWIVENVISPAIPAGL